MLAAIKNVQVVVHLTLLSVVVPASAQIFFGAIAEKADNNLSVIPDFISNCGMARVFAYLMQDHISMTDEAIFKDTSDIIKKAVVNTLKRHPQSTLFTKTAFEIALEKLL